jgi:FAD dependent oxidoreductase TIGR03364
LGHDLDRLLPEETANAQVTRCQLHMLRVAAPVGLTLTPALLTGTSLLRYSGFTACPSVEALRARLQADNPALLAASVNHMLTQAPGGDLLIGDTHSYDQTSSPFSAEELDELVLAETRALLGVERLTVRERWLGTYASAPDREYLTTSPAPGVVAATVTSGIGMTTALGLAPTLLDQLAVPSPATA